MGPVTIPASRLPSDTLVPAARPPRARLLRPSLLAALTAVVSCVPQQRADAGAAFQVSYADLAGVALVTAACLGAVLHRRRISPRVLVLLPPALAVCAATLASTDIVAGLPGLVRFLEIFFLVPLAVVLAVRDEFDRRLVLGSLVTAALVQAVVGWWQTLSGSGASYAGERIRAVGTFGALDVMGMATVVSYGTIIAGAVALTTRGRSRAAAVAVLAVLLPALVFSLSRGTWLACAVAVALMVALAGRRALLRAAVVGTCAVVLLAGTVPGSDTLTDRLSSITDAATQPDQSVTDRYGLWQAATGMWSDHPLLGVGPRGFVIHRDGYAPLQVSASSDTEDPVNGFQREELRSPHNMYLLVLSEQGLLGITAFCLLCGALIVWSIRALRTGRTPAGLVAAGFLGWQLTDFLYSDIGGTPTVVMSVMLGAVLSWAISGGRDLIR
ncbi:O-antigen ligase family protein [Nonomuraea sediminis]|uniref:O-antigen ligase family protein n=1 Tax=Nonomuraea sediminis TaxID=2835864 RepID=UPI001BDDA29F|nr:O-antigen ligase family protein [Nonomuraea sediminis]